MHVEISGSASGNLKLIHIAFIPVSRKMIIHLMNQPQCFEGCYSSHNLKNTLRYEVNKTSFNTFLNGSQLVTYRAEQEVQFTPGSDTSVLKMPIYTSL